MGDGTPFAAFADPVSDTGWDTEWDTGWDTAPVTDPAAPGTSAAEFHDGTRRGRRAQEDDTQQHDTQQPDTQRPDGE